MADIWMDVDTNLSEVPVNIMPLMDDTTFKDIEESVAYNAAGLELIWHFTTTAGATSATVVTPTTGGAYDWAHQDGGMYTIEIPASGGASINNDTEGFGWFTGKADGVLPWRGPIIGFRAAPLNDALIDGGDNLDVNATQWGGTAVASANVLIDGGITAAKIAADAITADKIADDAIAAEHIATGAIVAATFAAGAIDATAIADGAIDAATFAADVDAEILSYIIDDATRIDATALNTATGTTIPAILEDTGTTIPAALTTIDNEIEVIDGIVDSILEDTGTTIPGTITTIDDEIAVIDGIVDSILEDTGTTLPGTLTTIEGKIDTVDGIVDEILIDTGTTLDALIKDVPTNAEFEARTLPAADYVVTTDTIAGVTNVGTVTGNVNGSVGSVTAGVILADDAITAAKFDETTAFPLAAADTGATAVARTGADSDTLETLSDQIDGVSGGSGATAQEVWEYATRSLTDKAGFSLAADQSGVTIGTVNTLTGHTAQTGDSFARLGAPAGVSIAADIADIPTVSEFEARTLAASAYFDPSTDTVTVGTNNDKAGYSLTPNTGLGNQTADITGTVSGNSIHSAADVVTALGDGSTLTTCATATGFSTHSAADVVTALGDGSTLTTCATATGFSTHSAADVVTAMGDGSSLTACLTATGFSTHSAADVVTALGDGSTLTTCATATGFSTHSAADVVTAFGTGSTLTDCLTATGFSTFDPASDKVYLGDGAHGGASASLTLADYGDFQGSGGDDAETIYTYFTDGARADAFKATGFAVAGDAMTLTAAYDAAKTAAQTVDLATANAVLAKLDTTLVQDGAVYDFTAAALAAGPSGGESAATIYTYFTDGSRADAFKADVTGLATIANQNVIIEHLTDIKGVDWSTETLVTIGEDAATAAGATGGTGARTFTITVTDGTNPLEGATIRMKKNAEDYTVTTDANGEVTVGRDDGTWNVAITLEQYSFTPTTLVVDASTTAVEYEMTLEAITPPPTDDTTTVRIYTRVGGVPTPSVLVQIKQTAIKTGSTGYGDWDGIREARSNASGYVEFTVLRNAAHGWRIGSSGAFTSFTPNAPTYTAMASAVGHEPNR